MMSSADDVDKELAEIAAEEDADELERREEIANLETLVVPDDRIPSSDLDADEDSARQVLELDQTELDELGLTLDDPHQPDPDEE
jgi:hypothetical protein